MAVLLLWSDTAADDDTGSAVNEGHGTPGTKSPVALHEPMWIQKKAKALVGGVDVHEHSEASDEKTLTLSGP